MPTFIYFATDAYGKVSSGSVEARDQDDLRVMLRSHELYLTRFTEATKAGDAALSGQSSMFGQRVKPRDVVILIRQMGALVRAGVPLATALSTLQMQAEKLPIKIAMSQVQEHVVEGRPLHTAMAEHPKIFNKLTVALVQSGEGTGTLDKALEVAAFHLDREQDMRSRVKAGMVYPKLVVAAAIATVALMLLLVVPTFKTVYSQFHTTLPGPTLALLAISDFTMHFWWLIGLIVLAMVYGFRRYRATPKGKFVIDRLSLRLWIVGPVLRKVAVSSFVQTFSAGFRGGVPVLEALSLAASTAGNVVIRDAVMVAAEHVRDGQPIALELEKTGEFPPLTIQMIRSGEMSGTMDDMLDEINRYYDEDIRYSVDHMVKLVEPIMTVVVGSIVLFVLLALYMPIFNLGKAISGQH